MKFSKQMHTYQIIFCLKFLLKMRFSLKSFLIILKKFLFRERKIMEQVGWEERKLPVYSLKTLGKRWSWDFWTKKLGFYCFSRFPRFLVSFCSRGKFWRHFRNFGAKLLAAHILRDSKLKNKDRTNKIDK